MCRPWRAGELSALRETFPRGLPPRLLVLGTGGTGKTVLTKQVVVDLCSYMLGSEVSPGEQGTDAMQEHLGGATAGERTDKARRGLVLQQTSRQS